MHKVIKRICANQSGVSVTEFGLIAPVVMMMIMGTYDIGHEMYAKAVLNGALQEVGRDSSLEGSTNTSEQVAIDTKLKSMIEKVVPGARLYCDSPNVATPPPRPHICVTRRFYKTFSQAADANAEDVIEDPIGANGRCDTGEAFMDANHNGMWDEDGGDGGQGGARDVVIIEVKVRYDRLFPAAKMVGYGDAVQLVSDSVIANQPYGVQLQYDAPVSEDCP